MGERKKSWEERARKGREKERKGHTDEDGWHHLDALCGPGETPNLDKRDARGATSIMNY